MAFQETITNLGNTIINLVNGRITKHCNDVEAPLLELEEVIDEMLEGKEPPGTNANSIEYFVNNTPVNTLNTTAKTIVAAINELDAGSSGGGSVTVDSTLNATSENPVQNKTIYAAIGNIEALLSEV